MNYPQQPYNQPGYGQPPYAPVPQPGFTSPQPYTPAPSYPQPYPAQQQPYPAQFQAPPEPSPVDLPRGTLNDFFEQPAGGFGPALKFEVIGTRYIGVVARNITDADTRAQTKYRPRPGEDPVDRHPDGSPKLQMLIPLLVQPSQQFPAGEATWYVKANERADLIRAMEAAGVEPDPATGHLPPPRAGDTIDITFTHEVPNRGNMSPTKKKTIVYIKGNPSVSAPEATSVPQPVIPSPAPYPAPVTQQPQQGWNPYAAPPTPAQPPASAPPNGNGYPQAPAPGAAAQPPSSQVPSSQAPSSSVAPPADWPADVPFIPGLTPDMARIAAQLRHPAAGPQ